eukprot:scaffold2264_cov114-Isochrysis_galbana.AAC.11
MHVTCMCPCPRVRQSASVHWGHVRHSNVATSTRRPATQSVSGGAGGLELEGSGEAVKSCATGKRCRGHLGVSALSLEP